MKKYAVLDEYGKPDPQSKPHVCLGSVIDDASRLNKIDGKPRLVGQEIGNDMYDIITYVGNLTGKVVKE